VTPTTDEATKKVKMDTAALTPKLPPTSNGRGISLEQTLTEEVGRRSKGGGRMSATRERLPNRRSSRQLTFTCNDLRYTATISFFADGRLAEIFLGNAKSGSHSDSAAKDSAVVCSIALQFGVPVDVIRHALLRDARGVASSPLGAALDMIANDRSER
jgi:hypothetical protein